MKFSKVLTSTIFLIQLSSSTVRAAKKCSTWATEDCIGDIDIRYDPNASTNLVDLHPLYKEMQGLWVGTLTAYDDSNNVRTPKQSSPGPGRPENPYPQDSFLAFWNVSVSGSRFYQHDLYVYAPADSDFCAEELPPGSKNVLDDGLCGVNGYASAGEVFRTSTHEKDEISRTVAGTGGYAFNPETTEGYGQPLDTQVFYGTALMRDTIMSSQTFVYDSDYKSMYVSTQAYAFSGLVGTLKYRGESMGTLERVNEKEYLERIEQAYNKNNVTQATRDQFIIPTPQGVCLAQPCPTEEVWAAADPTMTESPYKEQYKVKAGVIAGFTILGALLLIAAIILFYQNRIKQIKKKARTKFASRMAQSTRNIVRHDDSGATPAELIAAFDRIDSGETDGGDGLISRDEMWAYVSSGHEETLAKGKMTEKEFDVLFDSIDKDGSGKIDFSEFCAFIAELNREVELVE